MKRDARLYDIVQSLRDGRLHTAAELGKRLGVSTRTIWRDMEMLAATGLHKGDRIGQGRENSKDYLKENPEVCDRLEAAIRSQTDRVAEEMMTGPDADDDI